MKKLLLFLVSVSVLVTACKKETTYVYEVDDQIIYESSTQKNNLKSTTQFISIAYIDLFNSNIPPKDLNNLDIAYQAMGDKYLLEDLIIKNFINKPQTVIPTNADMRNDVNKFVDETYLRILNRYPSALEKWKFTDLISKNTAVTPKMVYYALMTCEEYKYY